MEKAAARGENVPALKARPDVPLWLLPALDAWVDLGGGAPWWRVREWSEYHRIDLEWLLPVLRHAAHMVEEHLAKVSKEKSGRTPRRRTHPRH